MMLKGQIVLITGGAGLLGKTFAKAIVRQGGIAIIGELDSERGLCARNEIADSYGSELVDFVELDITSESSMKNALSVIQKRHGKLDALVNNAYPRNSNYGRNFFDVEYGDFCENVNMNVGGYFLASRIVAEYFSSQNRGNIVNIASIYGVIAPKFEVYEETSMTMPVEYAVIKSSIIHLTKYMAKYLKGKGIRVNSISPGGVLDAQPENFLRAYHSQCLNKGMLDKDDLCGTLVFLLSSLSAQINGQNLIVDDGFTL
jgi:NAD(P)-dependent dehydrogenase (short-subunit alcohol dehydrogenase family)